MFDDRIEITNPGGLGGGLVVEDLSTGKKYIRNHIVADTLNELKFIERAGTGIYEAMSPVTPPEEALLHCRLSSASPQNSSFVPQAFSRVLFQNPLRLSIFITRAD